MKRRLEKGFLYSTAAEAYYATDGTRSMGIRRNPLHCLINESSQGFIMEVIKVELNTGTIRLMLNLCFISILVYA